MAKVDGPIAAMLVERFPTRGRYTSMSSRYHFGDGWFGGFLPAAGLASVYNDCPPSILRCMV
jgi:hypothetical protein